MRPKVFLAILVGLALLLSFGVTVKDAQADAIMFPWITKSDTVATLISVVNTAGDRIFVSGAVIDYTLHYQYWHKAPSQTGICDQTSFKRPTSKDDIITFDAGGSINGGKALFNDPSPYNDASFKLSAVSPRRAFLLVDNNTPAMAGGGVNVDGTLYGEAMVLETLHGAGWGYIAYNASGGQTTGQTMPVRFDDPYEVLGEVIKGSSTQAEIPIELVPTILMPPDIITTRFFVTPVNIGNNTYDEWLVALLGQRIGNSNARVELVYQEPGVAIPQGGIMDNDEQPMDFTVKKQIVCTDASDLIHYMEASTYEDFRATGGQGWAYIRPLGGTIDYYAPLGAVDNATDEIIIGRLDYTESGVTIDGTTVAGALNNFVWLRNNGTATGIDIIHNEDASTIP